MAYENTHLYFAEEIRKEIENDLIKEIISLNLNQYRLGSIFPDTLSYSRKSKIRSIASYLHGNTGIPSNNFIFKMIEIIKKNKDEKELAFIFGYLTHCAVDITIHPVIYYFSGYNPNGTKQEKEKASYLHWHLETYLDAQINKTCYLENMIRIDYLDDLYISHILGIPFSDIRNALKRQISYFRVTRKKVFYRLYKLLSYVGIISKSWVGGFYENLNKEKLILPDNLIYKDIITGKEIKMTQIKIIKRSIEFGVRMIKGAYAYYIGNISRKQCEEIISGKNLDTGHFGKTKDDIRFTLS